MEQKSTTCAHCGKIFLGFAENPPVVRSDGKTFHVTLVCGPDPLGSLDGEATCTFAYAHDRIGPGDDYAIVSVLQANKAPEKVSRQIEDVADKLADLVAEGKKLARSYSFGTGQLVPGIAT